MSERLPYELQLQQQWIDLPLPDENMAWADMRRRLEEDDDRPVIAWWRRGCAGWIIIGLLLIAIIWWWLRPEQWFISESSTKQQQTGITEQTTNLNTSTNTNTNTPTNTNNTGNTINTTNTNSTTPTTAPHNQKAGPTERSITPGSITVSTQQQESNTPSTGKPNKVSSSARSNINSSGGGSARRNQRPTTSRRSNTDQQLQSTVPPVIDGPVPPFDSTASTIPDSQHPTPGTSPIGSSSIAKIDSVKKDSLAKPPVASTPKTDSSKKNKIFFSAGIAVHQQIPLAGQKMTPYSASGRKFSLADYLPSVYFRMNKENKWFIQGEFRYGAPQYTKDIEYRNRTKEDTINQVAYLVNTRSTVKKTFYHQLPVTFNYYILPGWSLGAGVAWNKFSSAIVDRQVTGRNTVTQRDTTFPGNGIVRVGRDSAFSNSYFQAVLETHYQWKRFSFGGRYMFGLQPYLKLDVPGGTREERNSSLQVFIRYELWRQRKK